MHSSVALAWQLDRSLSEVDTENLLRGAGLIDKSCDFRFFAGDQSGFSSGAKKTVTNGRQ
jgi:hypothetical protein